MVSGNTYFEPEKKRAKWSLFFNRLLIINYTKKPKAWGNVSNSLKYRRFQKGPIYNNSTTPRYDKEMRVDQRQEMERSHWLWQQLGITLVQSQKYIRSSVVVFWMDGVCHNVIGLFNQMEQCMQFTCVLGVAFLLLPR